MSGEPAHGQFGMHATRQGPFGMHATRQGPFGMHATRQGPFGMHAMRQGPFGMFTGLIADVGSVAGIERDAAGATLRIESLLAAELVEGGSVAVNGVCLTATDVGERGFRAEAMLETLGRCTLGDLQAGSRVNLELALRAQDRLGGHVVQGHVDGTGTVRAVREQGFARVLEIEPASGLERYLVEKGSVAIDGVSLTVSALTDRGFSVALIPETLQRTNLADLEAGASVNIEVDVIAKHLERLLEARR